MGGQDFECKASAPTAAEAFRKARETALYDYGHRGYTGTIAEKSQFEMVTPRAGETPEECVTRCDRDERHFNQEKWGPAACVDLGPDPKNSKHHVFIFFGVASS